MEENKTIYSYHAFLFPFRFEQSGKIDIIEVKRNLESAGWEYEPFTIKTDKDYNEFVYFYEYARDAIYNTEKQFSLNQTTYHFNYKIYGGKYIIKIKERDNPFELDITSISLKLYETGVAILGFQMENRKYPAKDDVKLINDLGRRTYPQYLPLEAVRGSFLSEYITIVGTDLELKEDFSKYVEKDFDISENQNPAFLPRFIKDILGEDFSDNKKDKSKIFVDPVIDDRMFTICWYGNDEETERLTKFDKEKKSYVYENDNFWYEFIFLDAKEATCQSEIMLPELLRKHSYDRWAGQGTLFGITRYSFMLISKRGWFPENVLLNHIKTMYHQLAILTLAQRASILNFSKQVTEISKLEENISNRVHKLHKDYIRFVNKMFFNEVTAQEQGIDIYDRLLDSMRIKENIKDLDNEISALHDIAELEEEKITSKAINTITIIGLYLLIPTFVTGFFGMNILNQGFIRWHENRWWMWIVYVVASFLLAFMIHMIIKFKNNKK